MYTRQPFHYFFKKKLNYENYIKFHKTSLNQSIKVKNLVLTMDVKNFQKLDLLISLLQLISKTNAKVCFSKKTLINFKIQKNQIIGFSVILKNQLMYDFLIKFIAITMPRSPFFEYPHFGISNGIITFQYKNIQLFHEYEKQKETTTKLPTLNITLNTTAKTKHEAFCLLKALQIPLNFKV